MAVIVSVQYNDGLLPNIIILLTQDYYHHQGTRLNIMLWLCPYSICNSILLLPCLVIYYYIFLFLMLVWCPGMAVIVSVQYNGGFIPDIILLT